MQANVQIRQAAWNKNTTLISAKAWCLNSTKCVGFSVPTNSTENATVLVQFTYIFLTDHPGEFDPSNVGRTAYWKGIDTTSKAGAASALRCLLSAPTDSLITAGLHVPYSDTFATDQWAPVIDGKPDTCGNGNPADDQTPVTSKHRCITHASARLFGYPFSHLSPLPLSSPFCPSINTQVLSSSAH